MCLRKLISGALAIIFLVSHAADLTLAAIPYPPSGYCENYKADLNYDRTQVPNRPLSDYLDPTNPGLSTAILNQIKADQLCMQIADAERLITKTSDVVKRTQLQKELESLEALQIEALEQLRQSGGIERIIEAREGDADEIFDTITDNDETSQIAAPANGSSAHSTTANEEVKSRAITSEELNTKYRYTPVFETDTTVSDDASGDDRTSTDTSLSAPVSAMERTSDNQAASSNVTVKKFALDDLPEATAVGTGVATKIKAPVYGMGEKYTFTMDTIETSEKKRSSFLAKIFKSENPKEFIALDYHEISKENRMAFHLNQKGNHGNFRVNHDPVGSTNVKITAKSKFLRWLANTGNKGLPFNFAKAIRYLGIAGFIVGAAADTYNIYKAEDRPKEVARVAGGWAGAAAVAHVGASAFASAGLAVGGPLGAIAGGMVGAVAGGIAGYVAGSKAGEVILDQGKALLNNFKFW